MAVISVLVFAGAMAAAISVIALAIGRQWRRIISLASGRTEAFMPLQQLAQAERRIAVRRWASTAASARLREAA